MKHKFLLSLIAFMAVVTLVPAACFVPTPNENGESYTFELSEASEKGLLEYRASGEGSINRVTLTLTSKTEDDLEIQVLPGTIFEPMSASVQQMVVTTSRSILVPSYETVGPVSIDAACASMELEVPGEADSLGLSSASVSSDLTKLLNLAEFESETFRVKQFAIWTITDNPERGDYMGIAMGGAAFGTGPTEEEMGRIRLLFEEAGIPIDRYQALQ